MIETTRMDGSLIRNDFHNEMSRGVCGRVCVRVESNHWPVIYYVSASRLPPKEFMQKQKNKNKIYNKNVGFNENEFDQHETPPIGTVNFNDRNTSIQLINMSS